MAVDYEYEVIVDEGGDATRTLAASSAVAAAASATEAAGYVDTIKTSISEASATAAASAATSAAATVTTSIAASATAVATSATNAATSATASKTSATAAATSATAAATSATNAATSATAAAASATVAANAVAAINDPLATTGGTMTGAVHMPNPVSLTSSSGVVTLLETSNSFVVSGTEAVTSITGWTVGTAVIRWATARTLTYNSASLILQGAVSRTTVVGDIGVYEMTSAGAREIAYFPTTKLLKGIVFTMVNPESNQQSGYYYVLSSKTASAVKVHCLTAPTSAMTIKIYQNSTAIGTVTLAASATSATLTLSSVSLSAGDLVYVAISGSAYDCDIISVQLTVVDA